MTYVWNKIAFLTRYTKSKTKQNIQLYGVYDIHTVDSNTHKGKNVITKNICQTNDNRER